jgi:methionyl-tRNA formyltransferase
MDIVLFAHQNWGVSTLKTILNSKHIVKHVFTHPLDMDKNEKIWYSSVEKYCKGNNIKFTLRKTVSDKDKEFIQNINPDLIFTAGWRRLLPKSIYQIARIGAINMHDGLLPNYRGFAPLNWAIINGEKEVGITVHNIDESADIGGIIMQEKIQVTEFDDTFSVYNKLLDLTPDLIERVLKLIEDGFIVTKSQSKFDGFFCSRRFPWDGQIDWKNDRYSIYNLIRGLCDPYPNAFCFHEGKKIFIKKARLSKEDYRGPPGRICERNERGVIITCGINHKDNQGLLIIEIEVDNVTYNPKDYFSLWTDLK